MRKAETLKLRTECYYYKGDRPCTYNRLCNGCGEFRPKGKKILIIKLASIGDVLRTTPILRALRDKYGKTYIVWLTSRPSLDVLAGNPFIDEILCLDYQTILRLQVEWFDIVISQDKAIEAAAMATLVKAQKKFGYGLNKEGRLIPLNREAEYEFSLGLSNEIKFKENKKTYQSLLFESIGLRFENQEYILTQDDNQANLKKEFLLKNGLKDGDFKVGFHTGCGDIFPYKKWTRDGFIELAGMLMNRLNAKILLFGGKGEESRNREIYELTRRRLIDTGCSNSLKEFIALLDCCDLVVSGDTLAMHIAIALKKKVVALFGPTCPQEIELYGGGTKIVSSLDCVPCYKNQCDRNINCMQAISEKEVFEAICNLKGESK